MKSSGYSPKGLECWSISSVGVGIKSSSEVLAYFSR